MSDPRPPLSAKELKKKERAAARADRDKARTERCNLKINDALRRYIEKDRRTKEAKKERALQRLEHARKTGRSTCVHFGDTDDGEQCTKFTLFIAPPKPKNPVVTPRLPGRTGYAMYDPYENVRLQVDMPLPRGETRGSRMAAKLASKD